MNLGLFNMFGQAYGATFSPCRKYRYHLWRCWGDSARRVVFIGLNPSTADESQDDPTIRRCIDFARRWEFGALDMLNVYGWRSTDPRALLDVEEPVGPENDVTIARVVRTAGRTVMAWGSHAMLKRILAPRAIELRRDLEGMELHELGHLGRNADGQPKHPLYLPAVTPFWRLCTGDDAHG